MIIETLLENGLVERKSDRGVYIRNKQTNGEYTVVEDLPNEEREKLGLEPYSYEETDKVIETDIYSPISDTVLEKAKAYDILVGNAKSI